MPQYQIPEKSDWSKALPEEYYSAITPLMDELTRDWFSEQDKADGYDEYIKACYIYGRMQQCADSIVPWMRSAIPHLEKKRVLEVGCGYGPSTPPIAMNTEQVYAFDITEECAELTARRCQILGIDNVHTFVRSTSWIEDYYKDPRSIGAHDIDIVFCYALLEHLTPIERYKMLNAVWRHIKVGGYLVIVELPNRLHWFDWHSAQLPFSDWLPDELALMWNARSERSNLWPASRVEKVEELEGLDRSNLYRFGRGASYHEFALAIGLQNMTVVGSAYSENPVMRSEEALGSPDSGEWTALLEKKLAGLNPPVGREFAPACLDLIIQRV